MIPRVTVTGSKEVEEKFVRRKKGDGKEKKKTKGAKGLYCVCDGVVCVCID